MDMPRRPRAAESAARHDLAGRLLRLPHVAARHRRAAARTGRTRRIRPLAAHRHQALRPLRHRPDRGRGVQRRERPRAARIARQLPRSWSRVGACAINGGLPAMRNHLDVGDILQKVYCDTPGEAAQVPNDPELPLLLDKVYPINEIVRVDYFLPGCPPSGDAIWKFLTDLILGRMPRLEHSASPLRLSGNRHMLESGNRRSAAKAAPHRHRSGDARRRPRQGDDPARRGQPGPSGAAAHRRVPRLRGFIEGRPYWEVPVTVQRLCGICPVSHHLAAAKAMDIIAGYGPLTPTAEKLRRLLHYGQMVQSHALHFFHLASPDLLLGFESEVAQAQHRRRRRGVPRSRQAGRADAQIRPGSHPPHRRQAHSRHRRAFPAASTRR